MSSKWYILAVAMVLFVALALAVIWRSIWLEAIDAGVLQTAVSARTPGLTMFMKSASAFGTGLVYLAVLGAGIVSHRHKSWKFLIIAIGSLALAQLVRLMINILIHRPRPSHGYWLVNATWYSFPSGHTVLAAVGFGLAAWLVWLSDHRAGTVAVVIAVLLTLIVGVSRVYLGVHWASDVAGSLAFAVAWLMLTFIVAARI